MPVESINNDSLMIIWNDIKDFGPAFWVFLIIFSLTVMKEQWLGFFKYIFDKCFIKKNKQEYSKKDLQKHPIFSDLEYWLTIGIDALHIKDNLHPDEDDYINNKERMAKEIMRIKYETMRESLKTFIEEIDIDNTSNEVACAHLLDCLKKESIIQKRKFNERGIPMKFLNKFYLISDISREIITNSIKNFFSNNCESSTPTKMYMAFNTLDGYLNVVFNDLCESLSTINGDLKNEFFDGKPMGKSITQSLRPPHPSYSYIVNDKLNSIMKEFEGARAMISKYFEKDGHHYHSVVYEVARIGVTNEMQNMQMISDETERNVLSTLEHNGCIAADISKFDASTIERFNARGVKGIILAPIYNDGILDGVLSIDYISADNFDKVIKRKDLDEKISKYVETLNIYIQYPKNYKY